MHLLQGGAFLKLKTLRNLAVESVLILKQTELLPHLGQFNGIPLA